MKPANRTFVISGGCSGLGLAVARDLHSAGACVSLLDMNADAGATVLKELGSERAAFFDCDVTSTESVKAAVDGTAAWIAKTGCKMGGVVAAAGVGGGAKVSFVASEVLARCVRCCWDVMGKLTSR